MSSDTLHKDILQLIKPQQVRCYAIAKGWQRFPNVNGDIALFKHPQGRFDQLIVPMDESFDDYAKRLQDVVENLAGFESRPVAEVLNDLLTPEADILRYRVASLATGRGSIPLSGGYPAVGRCETEHSRRCMQCCKPYRALCSHESHRSPAASWGLSSGTNRAWQLRRFRFLSITGGGARSSLVSRQ